jgi:hypothetical protein
MTFQRAVEGPDEIARWRRVEDAYENSSRPLSELTAEFGVSRSALLWRAKRDGWKRRYRITKVERPTIIRRLFKVLEVQVLHLEREMDEMVKADAKSGEREMQLLGKLAGNLEKLMKLDRVVSETTRRRERTAKEIADMRSKLTKRLEQLQRG